MKILHIGKYYPPYPGGIETYSKIICESLVSQGIDVDIVVANNLNQFVEENINGVRVFRLPRNFVLGSIPVCFMMPKFIRMLVKRNNYDAIHLHFPNPMGEISYLFGGNGKKLVITYHTDASMRNKLKLFYTPMINRIFKNAKYVVVFLDKFMQNKRILYKHRNKCRIIPIPINSFFLNEGDRLKTSAIKEKYGRFILFIGNLSGYKGEEYLIEAMKDIDCNLVIIGVGPNTENLKNLVKYSKLNDKVFFIGSIRNSDLKEYYDGCDLLCLPSVSEMETFGIVLLEAMARGKPVISTELGTGTSWVNINGLTGFVVPPKSAEKLSEGINKILENDALREQMGNDARKRVMECFTADKIINSVIELYLN